MRWKESIHTSPEVLIMFLFYGVSLQGRGIGRVQVLWLWHPTSSYEVFDTMHTQTTYWYYLSVGGAMRVISDVSSVRNRWSLWPFSWENIPYILCQLLFVEEFFHKKNPQNRGLIETYEVVRGRAYYVWRHFRWWVPWTRGAAMPHPSVSYCPACWFPVLNRGAGSRHGQWDCE